MIANWREFWDRPHRIYVNARHRDVHYQRVAEDIIAELPHDRAAVLDYGCGEALYAAKISALCRRLYLCEAAPGLRADLRRRFSATPSIAVIEPDEIRALEDGSLDLVVANSVLQYLTKEEAAALVKTLRTKLAGDGRLVLADIVPPDGRIVADVLSLLSSALANGYFFAAVAGLAETLVSDYRRLRRRIGLTAYREEELRTLLEDAGYRIQRRPANFGFNARRMTFIARPMH